LARCKLRRDQEITKGRSLGHAKEANKENPTNMNLLDRSVVKAAIGEKMIQLAETKPVSNKSPKKRSKRR
jgi:hypothetical protein